jgi:hypothetical protein
MADEPQVNPGEEQKPDTAPTPPAAPEAEAPAEPPAWDYTRSQLKSMSPAEYQEKRTDILRARTEGRIKNDIKGN